MSGRKEEKKKNNTNNLYRLAKLVRSIRFLRKPIANYLVCIVSHAVNFRYMYITTLKKTFIFWWVSEDVFSEIQGHFLRCKTQTLKVHSFILRGAVGLRHSFYCITLINYVHDGHTRNFPDTSLEIFITGSDDEAFVLEE